MQDSDIFPLKIGIPDKTNLLAALRTYLLKVDWMAQNLGLDPF